VTGAVRGVGVEVAGGVVRAVALADDADDPIASAEFVGAGGDDLDAVLGRVVAALVVPAGTPVTLAWGTPGVVVDAVDLTASTPGAVIARLRCWSAAGAQDLTVTTDERGRRSAVAVRWDGRAVAGLVDAARRAGLRVTGCEPVAVAAARHPGGNAAHGAALVAAGLVAAPVRRAIPPVPTTATPPPVWVIERLPDDPADGVGPNPTGAPARRRRGRAPRRREV